MLGPRARRGRSARETGEGGGRASGRGRARRGRIGRWTISLGEHTPVRERPRPTPFALSFSRSDGAVVVGIEGELDGVTAPVLEERLEDLLENQGNLNLVIDLGAMSFVDSQGLSVFVTAFRHLQDRGGALTLVRPTSSTVKLFEITGLDRVLAIRPA